MLLTVPDLSRLMVCSVIPISAAKYCDFILRDAMREAEVGRILFRANPSELEELRGLQTNAKA